MSVQRRGETLRTGPELTGESCYEFIYSVIITLYPVYFVYRGSALFFHFLSFAKAVSQGDADSTGPKILVKITGALTDCSLTDQARAFKNIGDIHGGFKALFKKGTFERHIYACHCCL